MILMKKIHQIIEDTQGVMERLGGNEALLDRLLAKFRETYKDTHSTLLCLLSESKKDEAYRIVHSIKGVSANLGIETLYMRATELETRMKADEYTDMEKEIKEFLSELERVLSLLE